MDELYVAAIIAGATQDPLISDIPIRMQKEGHTANLGDADMEYKKVSVTASMPLRIAEGMSVREFYESAERMGNQMAEQQAKEIFEKMSEPSPAGQTFTFVGEPTFDDIVSLWEKMEVRFDSTGKPIWPTIVSSPEGTEAIQRVLKHAAEDTLSRQKWAALVEKKRKEFDEREARRRLVE
jgi:hypothetical protein